MKRKSLILVVVLVLALALTVALAGCGGGQKQTASPQQPAQQQPAAPSGDNKQPAAPAGGSEGKTYTIKFPHSQPATEDSYLHIYATYFADRVYKLSNGRVKVEIYPGGQLGKDPEVAQQVQMGSVQMNVQAATNMVNMYKPLQVFMLPFLFDDLVSASRALDGPTAKKIWDDFEKKTGLKVLNVHLGGFRGITNSKKPIKSIDDFKGLKIRTPETPIIMDTIKALGASPVSVNGPELYTALQQGTVDGQESTLIWAYGQGFADVQKYVTSTKHFASVNPAFVNADWFNKLPADIQKAIQQAANEAGIYTNGFARMFDRSVIDQFKAKGLQATELNPKDMRDAVKSVYEKYAQEVGGMDVINGLIKDGQPPK